jgi:hypothetical protein
LTPFKVKQIATTLDNYVYTADDQLIAGQVEEGSNTRKTISTVSSRSKSAKNTA